MNQLCKVCGEPAAGFHFGAFTCEGCKSFFGRTYNNLSSLSECKNNGRCVINKKNRTSCKSCRLRKCLMVGMSKSGSRYGRRSNWFKIHCLLQDQAHMNGQMDGSLSYSDLAPKMVYPSKEESKDDELLTGSPDSHSDSCGELDSKTCNGYDGQVKSGSLSPLSPYESPSPPYDKKETFLPGIPMSPLSPISPLATLHHQKFFGQAAAAAAGFLHNGYNGYHQHRLASAGGEPLAFRPYAPVNNVDLLLKKRKAFVFDVAPSCTSTVQDAPMDLSVKKSAESVPEEPRATAEDKQTDEPSESGPSGHRGLETPLDLTKKGLPKDDESWFSSSQENEDSDGQN